MYKGSALWSPGDRDRGGPGGPSGWSSFLSWYAGRVLLPPCPGEGMAPTSSAHLSLSSTLNPRPLPRRHEPRPTPKQHTKDLESSTLGAKTRGCCRNAIRLLSCRPRDAVHAGSFAAALQRMRCLGYRGGFGS